MRIKTALLVFFLSILSITSIFYTPNVFAQTKDSSSYTASQTSPSDSNLHDYTQSALIEIMAAITCQVAGVDITNPQGECLGIDSKNGGIKKVPSSGGMIGMMGNLIGMTFNIPVSSHQYIDDLASNFGIAKHAYAQATVGGCTNTADPTCVPTASSKPVTYENGIGFTGLAPLLKLWSAFRNIVYLFFVLLFVVIGLGIMLRIKIDPRTTMSIQNQLPKIIVTLLLVTFSYAIAGFLIDIMYVTLYLIFEVFARIESVQTYNPTNIQGSNPFEVAGGLGGVAKLAGNASTNVVDIIGSLFSGTIGNVITFIIGGPIAAVGSLVGIPVNPSDVGGAILSTIGTAIGFLIFAIAILAALFRLWWALLKAYIYTLVLVVLAPFYIALGLLPGATIGFGSWFRDLLANLSAFPATLLMFLLAKVFVDMFSHQTSPTQFVPPFIGNPGDLKGFGAIIGVGFLFIIPDVVNITKQIFKAPQNKYTGAVGGTIGGVTGQVKSLAKGGAGLALTKEGPGGTIATKGGTWGRFGAILLGAS